MRIVRPFLFVFLLWSGGSVLATELFLLNKTGQPLYYKLHYFTFGQIGLHFISPIVIVNKKVKKWFHRHLKDRVKEGWVVKDGIAHISSYWIGSLLLKKDKNGKSLITSISGDQRILDMCYQAKKVSECKGNVLRGLKPSIKSGVLHIHRNNYLLKEASRPVVLAVTLDPVKEKHGKTGYVLTELAHTWGLIRQPESFFYELQGIRMPK